MWIQKNEVWSNVFFFSNNWQPRSRSCPTNKYNTWVSTTFLMFIIYSAYFVFIHFVWIQNINLINYFNVNMFKTIIKYKGVSCKIVKGCYRIIKKRITKELFKIHNFILLDHLNIMFTNQMKLDCVNIDTLDAILFKLKTFSWKGKYIDILKSWN